MWMKEMIREQMFRLLGKEVPYHTAVQLSARSLSAHMLHLDVTLLVSHKSHKGILIGKEGRMLKQIGEQSRIALEKHVKKKIMLRLWVKIEKSWHNQDAFIEDLIGPL